MWEVGFERKMSQWVSKEKEVTVKLPNSYRFSISEQIDKVKVSFKKGDEEKRLVLTYVVMYSVLVPKGEMDYYYLLEDVLLAMEDDSALAVVNQHRKELLTKLVHDFWKKRDLMEDVTEIHTFKTELIECKNGEVYEQFVLC